MKKIFFYILSIVALAGCMERSEFVPENSVPAQDMKEYVAPLELTLGGPQTKSYDEDLNWTWEESDKIYGYQVAGGKSVNTLSFVEDNRFGTPEFAYASEDAATFHFVYAGDATLDEAAEGNRGIRQDSRQSGEWRPVLVGSAVGKTISEVMNDEAEINMEHLSAALEVRLWKEGVDKNNLTDADKKNIVYAELMSDTENFLLDVVPVYNLDGTVSYADRERGQDEEDGGYIRTEYVNSPVAVFNVAPHAENYQAGALRLAVVDENGDRYVLNVPSLNFVAGQRTILNVEWKTPTSAYLPDGETFNSTVDAFMTGKGITEIKFITNSAATSEDVLVEGSIYMVQKEQTLEIHTNASQFMANIDCQYMFSGKNSNYTSNNFKQIVSIDFGDNFNTQNVTDMTRMFYNCSALTSLDLSKFNTQNVTDMSEMFSSCSGLTSLDVSNFITQNVTDMSEMFSSCSGLTSLDVSNFNTTNVTNMSMMFSCEGLTSLDLSNFNTQNVTDMSSMFSSCSGLTSLDLSKFNTQNVTDMSRMFSDCSGLTSLDVSNFNTRNVTNMRSMFNSCSGLTSLDVSKFNTQNVTNMRYMFNSCSGLTSLDISKFNTQNVTDMYAMFCDCSGLTSLDVSNFNTTNVTDMRYMFSTCMGLTSLNLSNFNTENVTDMRYMFSSCSGLTSLDVSNFNTQNVTNMRSMFDECCSLTSLDLRNFNTENVTNMYGMFYNCSGLTSLDVSKFNTQNVTDMHSMFFCCSSLTSLDLSNFNTTNVTDMGLMFCACSALTSLDLSKFNTQNVTSMYSMFDECASLTSLDVSNFNTQNVTNMSKMFSGCWGLTSLDVSNFNTQNVTDMNAMFVWCFDLTELDLSSFSFIATPNITNIFYYTGRNAANKPIPIYVTEEGKSYIETTGGSSINNEYATLIIKSVGI